jgi:uncharacterized protein YjbJ (UPF0337 family)
MDKDRIKGSLKHAAGVVKKAAGRLLGDTKMEAEGATLKTEGKVQNAAGGAKDALREVVKPK